MRVTAEKPLMRGKSRLYLILVLAVIAAAVAGTTVTASEEGQTSSKDIVLECKPGTVTKKLSSGSASAKITHPDCICDKDPEVLKRLVVSQAEKWRSGDPRLLPGGESFSHVTVNPGEQVDVTFYCLTPGQIAEYRDAILSEEENP
jgi:hypothetical protein